MKYVMMYFNCYKVNETNLMIFCFISNLVSKTRFFCALLLIFKLASSLNRTNIFSVLSSIFMWFCFYVFTALGKPSAFVLLWQNKGLTYAESVHMYI